MSTSNNLNLFEIHNSNMKPNPLSYRGPFDKHIISLFAEYIKRYTINNQLLSKKLFKIFIELAQNVSYYSAEKSFFSDTRPGAGSMIMHFIDDCYSFSIGNLIQNEELEILLKKCEIINSLDRENLRIYKRRLRNLIPGTKGGAHIGLIMVALTTEKPLEIEVTKINDEFSFFTIHIVVEKNKEVDDE